MCKYIGNIFEKLNKKIKYCHFKSNEHLDRSFAGKTDFDLLVHKKDIYRFQKILNEFGFKRRISTADKQYYGMENYIDRNSGKRKLKTYMKLLSREYFNRKKYFNFLRYYFLSRVTKIK